MGSKEKILAAISIFVLNLVNSEYAFSFSGGISGYSGNPATTAGSTCSTCHSGGIAPAINLTGPTTVRPGTISTFTLTISDGQRNSGGLDISVDGGTLINRSTSTQLLNGEITQKLTATAAGDGTVSWSFDWQAPKTLGSYEIFLAGLSTNGDSSTTGDSVATDTYFLTVSRGAPQSPRAAIRAPVTAQVDTTINFKGSKSFDSDGIINQYEWDFGDGNTASGEQATNAYNAAGTYTVTLTVTDSDNLTNSTFWDIIVGGVMVPVADPGGPYTGFVDQAINFDGSLSTHVEAITNYIWDFGDGSALVNETISTVSHIYNQPGAYTVTLAVQDANIITGVASTTVVIDAIVTPPATDGPTLYADNCSACHGALVTSSKLNSSASQIQVAIDANIGGMGGLTGLTPTEVQAIADALVSTTPPPPPATDGPTLYANNCSACHGALATSNKLNSSASQIQVAIDANTGGMGGLTGLTPTEVQAIADALVSTTPPPEPTTGQGLYDKYCLACHGPGGTGGLYEAVTGKSADSTVNAINNEPLMNSISLSPEQIQAITDYLSGSTSPPPAPTTGEGIYAAKCAACHGPGGTGGIEGAIIGAGLNKIQNSMLAVDEMQSIPLSDEEAQALAAYLSEDNGGGI